MMLRRARSILASMALVGVGMAVPGAAATSVAAASVHPLPFAPTHVLTSTLSFPPTTAYCRANLGISCYQPAQFQQAYDLEPLFNQGLTGAGSTIVIVDAFASATITKEPQHLGDTFG